jgi:hypothetical protein
MIQGRGETSSWTATITGAQNPAHRPFDFQQESNQALWEEWGDCLWFEEVMVIPAVALMYAPVL